MAFHWCDCGKPNAERTVVEGAPQQANFSPRWLGAGLFPRSISSAEGLPSPRAELQPVEGLRTETHVDLFDARSWAAVVL